MTKKLNVYPLIIKVALFAVLAIVAITFLSKHFLSIDISQIKVAASSNVTTDINNLTVMVHSLQDEASSTTLPSQLSSAGGPNDGLARSLLDCYGHFSDAEPLEPGYEYYDCAVPYKLKTSDIGGLQYRTEADHGTPYDPIINEAGTEFLSGSSPKYCGTIGFRGTSVANLDTEYEGVSLTMTPDEAGMYYFNVNGIHFYFSALQFYFYPEWLTYDYNDGKGKRGGHPKDADPLDEDEWEEYYNWYNVAGELFDAILTDGTVIHCVVSDANSTRHTNHGLGDRRWDKQFWRVCPLKLPQYACLFSCHQQTLMEMAGPDANAFRDYFNLGDEEDSVRVSYIRMYNKTLSEYIREH